MGYAILRDTRDTGNAIGHNEVYRHFPGYSLFYFVLIHQANHIFLLGTSSFISSSAQPTVSSLTSAFWSFNPEQKSLPLCHDREVTALASNSSSPVRRIAPLRQLYTSSPPTCSLSLSEKFSQRTFSPPFERNAQFF